MNNIYKTCRFHKTFFPWALMGNYVIFTFFIIESIWEVHKAFQKRFGVYSLSLSMSVFLLSFFCKFLSRIDKELTLIVIGIMLGKGLRILETQRLWRSLNFARKTFSPKLWCTRTFPAITGHLQLIILIVKISYSEEYVTTVLILCCLHLNKLADLFFIL